MRSSIHRCLSGFLALSLLLTPSLAPVVRAAEAKAKVGRIEALRQKFAEKTYAGVSKVLRKILSRANRSERINLKLAMCFLDAERRMFFDIQGVVRAKIPGEKWLGKIREMMEAGRTWTMSSNGPVSLDIAVTPMKIEGQEVTFTVQLDVTLLLTDIFQELARAITGILGAVAVGALAGKVSDALASLDTDTAGQAVGTAVEELSAFMSGEAGAIAYMNYRQAGKGLARFIPKSVNAASLRRHFVIAILFAASSGGAKIVGTSLGAALGSALLPAGGGVVAVLLATTAAYWFGTWVVHEVAVKLPILWKLKKIDRLARKAAAASGAKKEKLQVRLVEYTVGVVARLEEEMNRKANRWVFFELMTEFFRARVKEGDGSFDLSPYRPLIDKTKKILQFRAVGDEDWYAARMYYQLLDAIEELPAGKQAPEKK